MRCGSASRPGPAARRPLPAVALKGGASRPQWKHSTGRGPHGWAAHPRRVGNGDGGEQAASGADRARDQHHRPEPGGERAGVQVDGAGNARQRRERGDSQQAADPGHVVVHRRRDSRVLRGRGAHRGRGERRIGDREAEREDDDGRQDMHHIAGAAGGRREQDEAGAGHDRAEAHLQPGPDPGREPAGPCRQHQHDHGQRQQRQARSQR